MLVLIKHCASLTLKESLVLYLAAQVPVWKIIQPHYNHMGHYLTTYKKKATLKRKLLRLQNQIVEI